MLKKILAITGGTLLVSIFALWALFVRAPSVEAQCEHLLSLAAPEVVQHGREELRANCLESAAKGEYEGLVPYAKRSKCLMAAKSYDDLESCK